MLITTTGTEKLTDAKDSLTLNQKAISASVLMYWYLRKQIQVININLLHWERKKKRISQIQACECVLQLGKYFVHRDIICTSVKSFCSCRNIVCMW